MARRKSSLSLLSLLELLVVVAVGVGLLGVIVHVTSASSAAVYSPSAPTAPTRGQRSYRHYPDHRSTGQLPPADSPRWCAVDRPRVRSGIDLHRPRANDKGKSEAIKERVASLQGLLHSPYGTWPEPEAPSRYLD